MDDKPHSRPIYRATFHDIDVYAADLRERIGHLQVELENLMALQSRHQAAETRRCLFCGGTMRDLEPLIAFGGFASLGGDYSTLGWATYGTDWAIPERWECQDCSIHDCSPPPKKAQLWDDASPPSKHAFAHVLFEAFPRVTQIAYDSGRGVWYLGTVETWYAATGTREVLCERWGITAK